MRLHRIAIALLLALALPSLARAGDAPPTPTPPAAAAVDAAPASAPPAPASPRTPGRKHRHPAKLDENSTLAQWKAAPGTARSHLAVALARKRLTPDPDKLELAKTAMEISGCLTATAKDPRFAAWQIAPTAKTCLEAEERPSK